MKTKRTWILAILCLLSFAAGAEDSASRITLKLPSPLRQARQELTAIESDLARVQIEIRQTRSQIQVLAATRGANTAQVSALKTLADAYELQEAALIEQRNQVISQIKAQ